MFQTVLIANRGEIAVRAIPVSYTPLEVYKRQVGGEGGLHAPSP
nr:hypothetical protein [Pseudomonas sp. HS-2]